MKSLNLNLYNWKCYKQKKINLDLSKSIFISGQNGIGKTSLWLAIYSLIKGSTPSNIKLSECIKASSQYFGISTDQNNLYLTGKINLRGVVDFKSETNSFFEKVKLFEYLVYENDFFSWNREPRLKYYDSIITNIYGKSYYTAIQNLNRALRSKTEILRKYKHLKPSVVRNLDSIKKILIHYNQIIAEESMMIWTYRKKYFEFLKSRTWEFCRDLNLSDIQISTDYKQTNFKGVLVSRSEVPTFNEIFLELNNLLDEELKLAKSIYGAHKDDVDLLINGLDLYNYLSRGQIRMWVIFQKISAIKLFKISQGDYDIWFFLDDVFNEIDSNYENILLNKWFSTLDKLFFTGVRVPDSIASNINYQIVVLSSLSSL